MEELEGLEGLEEGLVVVEDSATITSTSSHSDKANVRFYPKVLVATLEVSQPQ